MNDNSFDDWSIYQIYKSTSTFDNSLRNADQGFKHSSSCKDWKEYKKKNSIIEYTKSITHFNFDKDEFESISGDFSLEDS